MMCHTMAVVEVFYPVWSGFLPVDNLTSKLLVTTGKVCSLINYSPNAER